MGTADKAGQTERAAANAAAAEVGVGAAQPASGAASAADDEPLHPAEAVGLLSWFALLPLSVLGVRWLTQRRLQRMMDEPSSEQADEPLAELAADEVRAAAAPRFEQFDASRSVPGAVEAREAFVARSLSWFRRAVLIDVAIGALYVALLLAVGYAGKEPDRAEIGLGLAILGAIYPLLAALRYVLYRKQFRPLDARFRSGWVEYLPFVFLARRLAAVFSPRFQTFTAGTWAALMLLFGLGLAFEPSEPALARGLAAALAAAALLHGVVAWLFLRRLQTEPGVRLLVLRVFGIDANARFTFGRLLAFWQHFGHYFTVLDPSIWRYRYPLLSMRTLGFLALMAVVAVIAVGLAMELEVPEAWVFVAGCVFLLGVLGVYSLLSVLLLRRGFIRSREHLRQLLGKLERRPRQLDLTFRSMEAMCHGNTWKPTVAEFAQRCQVLLMDLRGFSEARKGCTYEVDFLLDVVPIERVLFLVEDGGDHEAVRRLVLQRWEFLRTTSPNLALREPVVRLYVSRAKDERDVQGILDLLIHGAAAAATSPQPALRR
jgi:hypothetical protein